MNTPPEDESRMSDEEVALLTLAERRYADRVYWVARRAALMDGDAWVGSDVHGSRIYYSDGEVQVLLRGVCIPRIQVPKEMLL